MEIGREGTRYAKPDSGNRFPVHPRGFNEGLDLRNKNGQAYFGTTISIEGDRALRYNFSTNIVQVDYLTYSMLLLLLYGIVASI